MTITALMALLLAAGGTAERAPPARAAAVMSEAIVVRVPLPRGHGPAPAGAAPPARWREAKGPRCIVLAAVAGAAITAASQVDLVLRGGKRLRARLDRDCPALDYYSGFYLVSPGDGRICANRDSVHARSGGACAITRLRLLRPAPP